jgi:mannose-6-phosphate isomerase
MKPVVLEANQFPHFYRGGRAVAAFRGRPDPPEYMPEDWVASTTSRFGADPLGQSTLPDGRPLRDAVAADPLGWLGPAHVAASGADPNLLVKLLDAGERLVVHCHPDRAFAGTHLGCAHGKTEAWVVLSTSGDRPLVYLGFRDGVEPAVLRRWVREQDTAPLLAALNPVPVRAGDAILVPAGIPHALGAGVFITELQEPTDFSVLLEWRGYALDGAADGHLDLGFDTALGCVDTSGWDAARLAGLRGPDTAGGGRERLLPPAADPFFRAERVGGGTELDAAWSVLVVTSGNGVLDTRAGGALSLRRGETVLVPYGAGPAAVSGDVDLVRCLPPAPEQAG